MSEHIKTIWSTKYCLTGNKGITEHELIKVEGGMAIVKSEGYNRRSYFHGNDWHYTKEQATARFNVMVDAKRKSLEKALRQLAILEDNGPTFKPLEKPGEE